MSTRCQITILKTSAGFQETGGIFIYKHSDGYPSGVLPILMPLAKLFTQKRPNDAPYLLAQIVRAFAIQDHIKSSYTPQNGHFTGWG